MPKPSPFKLIKRAWLYRPRKSDPMVPPLTRGFYVLYRAKAGGGWRRNYEVTYIGVGGISNRPNTGIAARLISHRKTKASWTHFSAFEVHDNVGAAEIRELEALLLLVLRDDHRLGLENKQYSAMALRFAREFAQKSRA